MIKKIKPQKGQESVWDYPRPPRLESFKGSIRVYCDQYLIVDARDAYKVLETSHPPVYYIPPSAIEMALLKENNNQSFCEWKGLANYYDLQLPDKKIDSVGWFYKQPSERFKPMAEYVAFYPSKVSRCLVNGEEVQAQDGDFYGGWITSNIVGPFKGAPGTWGW